MAVVYLSDTTGLGNYGTGILKAEENFNEFKIYPNPFDKNTTLSF